MFCENSLHRSPFLATFSQAFKSILRETENRCSEEASVMMFTIWPAAGAENRQAITRRRPTAIHSFGRARCWVLLRSAADRPGHLLGPCWLGTRLLLAVGVCPVSACVPEVPIIRGPLPHSFCRCCCVQNRDRERPCAPLPKSAQAFDQRGPTSVLLLGLAISLHFFRPYLFPPKPAAVVSLPQSRLLCC